MSEPSAEPRRPRQVSAPPFETFADEAGIGGWLLLFCVMEGIAVLANLRGLPENFRALGPEAWAVGEQAALYRPLVVFELIANVVLAGGGAIGLFLIFRRHPRTPLFFVALLAFSAICGVVEMLGAGRLYEQLLAITNAAGGNAVDRLRLRNFRSDMTFRGFQMLVVGAGWAFYWRISDRVARTFGQTQVGANLGGV